MSAKGREGKSAATEGQVGSLESRPSLVESPQLHYPERPQPALPPAMQKGSSLLTTRGAMFLGACLACSSISEQPLEPSTLCPHSAGARGVLVISLMMLHAYHHPGSVEPNKHE
jgi:hypothetical protein